MDCLAIIPAKGRSRRIPRKNFQRCGGVPLWVRAATCAVRAGIFREVIVSSEEEIAVPPGMGFHHRHPLLSEEGVGVDAVVFAILAERDFRDAAFCVLWPTSPLRTPEILRAMWEQFTTRGMSSLHSVFPGPGKHEYTMIHDGTALFMRTLEFLKRVSLDCTPHCWDKRFVVWDSLDVNTPEDLAEAERRLLAREAACSSG